MISSLSKISRKEYSISKPPRSKEDALAEEIWAASGKKEYPAILKVIKEKGYVWSFETWEQMKKRGIVSKEYFFGCAKNTKIQYESTY